MAYPTKYSRQYDFQGYQVSNPTRPLPGDKVNVDLNAVVTSVDELVEFLKTSIRSDGRLANESVGVNQLDATFDIGFSLPTTWESGVAYTTDSTVFHNNKFYKANTAHTSGSGFDESKWDLIVDFGEQATAAAASATAAAASETAAATSATSAAASATAASGSVPVANRTALKALDSAKKSAVIYDEDGRNGLFLWQSGDYSAQVTADTREGVYVKATATAATSGAWVRAWDGHTIDIRWFGAVCDDSADDGAAINAAISALPTDGGTVIVPGRCKTSAVIAIGDGTDATLSTRWGVRLVGSTPPAHAQSGSDVRAATCAITYTGGSVATGVVSVLGPLVGWEVSNLEINAGGLADHGLYVMSASQGVTENLVFQECDKSYYLGCYSGAGYTPAISANSDLIRGGNILIYMPEVDNSIGMLFDGPSDGTASTCFVTLDTVRIYLPSTAHSGYGVIRKVCDTVSLTNLFIFAGTTAHASTYGVVDDYSGNASFPCGCVLDTPDVGWNLPAARQYIKSGDSSSAAGPNIILNLSRLNGSRYPTSLANTYLDLPQKAASDVLLTGQTAAIAFNVIYTPQHATLFKVSYLLAVTTTGSAGTIELSLNWKDPNAVDRGMTLPALTVTSGVAANHIAGSVLIYTSSAVGTYIGYSTIFTSVTGSPQYTVALTIERMN